MHSLRLLITLGLLAFAVGSFGQQPALELSKTQILYGEPIDFTLSIELTTEQKSQGLIIPDSINPFLGSLELTDSLKRDTSIWEDESGFHFLYTLSGPISGFDSGSFEVGPIPVLLGGDTLFSNTLMVGVFPAKVDTTAEVKPIKDNVAIPLTLVDYIKAYWYYPVLLAVLVFAIIWLLRWYSRKPKKTEEKEPVKVAPKIPADEKALDLLRKLLREKAWEKQGEKEFYSNISLITRNYLAERYHMQALEKTSAEIIEALRFKLQPKSLLEELSEVLNLADMVKFAKEKPGADYAKSSIEKAIAIVEQTAEPKEQNA
ncbi:MAG: hypothetical protein ACPF8V_03935 [Luteibaculum sp.]